MTIGYRVMGSGPGPERIGDGRRRFVWSPGMARLGRHVLSALSQSVCLGVPSRDCYYSPT